MDKVAIKENEQPQESQISMAISPPLPSIFNIQLVKNSHVHRFWFSRRPAYIDFGQKKIKVHRFQSNPYSNTIDLRGAHPKVHRFLWVEHFLIPRSIDFCGKQFWGPSIWGVPHPKVHRLLWKTVLGPSIWGVPHPKVHRFLWKTILGSIDLRGAPSQGPSIFVENNFRVHRFEGCPIPRSIDFCGRQC